MKLNPFLHLSLSVLLYNGAVAEIQYSIETNWNGKPVVHPAANLTLSVGPTNDTFTIHVQAAYFGSPEIPDCEAGYPYDALYNFEVVETFFLCSESNEYVELEFAPCGAHLVLLLYPTRNALVEYLPLEFTAQIDRQAGVWIGDVIVPTSFLPADVNRFNAFAIHSGTPEEQVQHCYTTLAGQHSEKNNLNVL
ncbi:UPF0462 protein C4orf33 homolog [Eurytemora carolleeae]|uniref:UPF0462 protein C4orf33 homolog n=1 Tax=Eurytemora carolleeae TaxID=1294199 RepID=UPI000C76C937|nr:UPF0462 protein C4orf33 homolog [Eurytemora carolleeae]|eukprot:XP_023345571.1 UPF0462 protein C4orf33 homolog [Eurytemora affinis]